MRPERFEFATDKRGPGAWLAWKKGGHEHQVVLADWPHSLFSMLRADVLGPQAHAEAELLTARCTLLGLLHVKHAPLTLPL